MICRSLASACALVLVTVGSLLGCSTALTQLNAEQALGLKQAQRIADQVTKAYGVPGVRIYASAAPGLGGRAGGTYSYRNGWIFLRSSALTGPLFFVVLSHELGHATLDHRPIDVRIPYQDVLKAFQTGQDVAMPTEVRREIVRKENEANHRGVEILVRFFGQTQEQALEHYTTYFIEASLSRGGRNILMPFGQALPCEQLEALWASFGKAAPPCEASTIAPKITECPYDDWMSTGCKAGQPLDQTPTKE